MAFRRVASQASPLAATLCRAQSSTVSSRLKIVVLGATGDTGQPLVKQALALGHEVTAVVRDRSKFSLEHPSLTVVTGDVCSATSLQPHFMGQDAVVSVLGFPKVIDGVVRGFTDSMAATIQAMTAAKLRRVVTISAWYTNPQTRIGQPGFDNMWAKVPGLVNTLDNEGEMEQLLEGDCSNIDFTAVRVPTLTWDADTGKAFNVQADSNWVEGKNNFFMPREDVARFMLSTLQTDKWNGKKVAIAIEYSDEEMGGAAKRFKEHMAMYTEPASKL